MAMPCTTLRVVGMRASSLPLLASNTDTDASRLFVAIRRFPSLVVARLYTPGPAGSRRTSDHDFVSISTISLDLLHATQTRVPSRDGCAQVGEHDTSPGLGGSMPCPPMSCPACSAAPRTGGAPVMPFSFPHVRKK